MEFVFQLSSYDDPALEDETVDLLCQRLEARSREAMPGMWRLSDRLNTRQHVDAAVRERRCKRYRIYGFLLLAQGVFVLVPGLMERLPNLIIIGCFAILCGVLEFAASVKGRKPPASCRREAAQLLAGRRAVNWEETQAEIRFDENGMSILVEEDRKEVPYARITEAFETGRLLLVAYDAVQAVLLQKKDLISGEAGALLPYIREKIAKESGTNRGMEA